MKNLFIVVLVLMTKSLAIGQTAPDAMALLREVNKKFASVKDYQVDALIDARISFLKILPQRAKVYFKSPDKFRVKSKGIAILPKQNFDQLFQLMADEKAYMAFITGNESLNGKMVTILNLIPLSDTTDLVLAKIWVDTARDLIVKSQLTTKSNGTVLIDYFHGNLSDYALPDKMIFTIDVKRFKIPKAIAADINSKSTAEPNKKEPKTGQIIISFSNYIFNKGLSDEYFKKD